jgi:hypothetical protein
MEHQYCSVCEAISDTYAIRNRDLIKYVFNFFIHSGSVLIFGVNVKEIKKRQINFYKGSEYS